MTRDDVELTVVLNLHHEGRLVHPTARSIERSLAAYISTGGTARVVAVLDFADDATAEYVRDLLPSVITTVAVEVLEVRNGDLGLSRNSGTSAAHSRFIAFCDADNLVSENWFASAVKILRAEAGPVAVHPAWIVAFEARDTLWKIRSTRDTDFDPLLLAQSNLWDATTVTTVELATKIPYRATHAGQGFGPEDWHWNLETLVAGTEHLTADGTALFYRAKRRGSLLAEHEGSNALLPPTRYLSDPSIAAALVSGTVPQISPRQHRLAPRRLLKTLSRRGARFAYHRAAQLAGDSRRFKRSVRVLREAAGKVAFALQEPPAHWAPLPTWLTDEWRAMSTLEPFLFPEDGLLTVIDYWDPSRTAFADIYWKLVSDLSVNGHPIDYLYLVPWLNEGGADKVTLNYVKAIADLRPGSNIAVLGTERGESRWSASLPDGVIFVSVPDAFHALGGGDQEILLGQLLVQLAPRRIHLINSQVGFRTVERYSRALATQSMIYISAFTLDEWPSGRRWHYILEGVRDYIDHIDAIFTDNEELRRFLLTTYALPESKVTVHPQPIDLVDSATRMRREFSAEEPLRVLWAGRIDRQKRVDVVARIAEEVSRRSLPVEFHVFGKALLDGEPSEVADAKRHGVHFHGAYRGGLASVGVENYDLFLMTSQWEGLPLTLLDAISLGLPTLAPSIGGIPEAFEGGSELVERFDHAPEYVDAIERIMNDYALAMERARVNRSAVRKRHSWQSFEAHLDDAGEYLS